MLSYVRHYPLAIAKLMCLCSPKSADLLLTNTGGFLWNRQSYLLLVFIFPPVSII